MAKIARGVMRLWIGIWFRWRLVRAFGLRKTIKSLRWARETRKAINWQ